MRLQVDTGSFSQVLHTWYFETAFCWALSSLIWRDWLSRELRNPSFCPLPALGLQLCVVPQCLAFTWVLGIQTKVFMISCQTTYSLSHVLSTTLFRVKMNYFDCFLLWYRFSPVIPWTCIFLPQSPQQSNDRPTYLQVQLPCLCIQWQSKVTVDHVPFWWSTGRDLQYILEIKTSSFFWDPVIKR